MQKELTNRIEVLNSERADMIQKNGDLSDQIGDKATARDLQLKFKDQQATLKQIQEERSSYQAQSDDCDIPIARHRVKLKDLINEYNQTVLSGSAEGLNISLGNDLIDNLESLQARIEAAVPIIKSENRETREKITTMKMDKNTLQQEIRMLEKDRDELDAAIAETREGIKARLSDYDKVLDKQKSELGLWKGRQKSESKNRDELQGHIVKLTNEIEKNKQFLSENSFEKFKEQIDEDEAHIQDELFRFAESSTKALKTAREMVNYELDEEINQLRDQLERESEAGQKLDENVRKYRK